MTSSNAANLSPVDPAQEGLALRHTNGKCNASEERKVRR